MPPLRNMAVARVDHRMVLLTTGPNAGKVLVVSATAASTTAELFDAGAGTFSTIPTSMAFAHGADPTATLLANGDVLIVGGSGAPFVSTKRTASHSVSILIEPS